MNDVLRAEYSVRDHVDCVRKVLYCCRCIELGK